MRLSALTDYPDFIFEYDKNEAMIDNIIKESYKNTSIRSAYFAFIQITAEDKFQASKKLA